VVCTMPHENAEIYSLEASDTRALCTPSSKGGCGSNLTTTLTQKDLIGGNLVRNALKGQFVRPKCKMRR